MVPWLLHAVGRPPQSKKSAQLRSSPRPGAAECCGASHMYSELWRPFWALVADIGSENVSVRKVKAHTSRAQYARGSERWLDVVGNDEADKLAKLGARMHARCPNIVRQVEQAEALAGSVAGWIGIAAEWANSAPRDNTGHSGAIRRQQPGRTVRPRQPPLMRHMPECLSGSFLQWGCTVCGTRASTKQRLLESPCSGQPCVAARAHGTHRLWMLGK
eukprot:325779-Karenia_brevis.AAC.1